MAQYPKSFRDDVEQVGGVNVIPVEDVEVAIAELICGCLSLMSTTPSKFLTFSIITGIVCSLYTSNSIISYTSTV